MSFFSVDIFKSMSNYENESYIACLYTTDSRHQCINILITLFMHWITQCLNEDWWWGTQMLANARWDLYTSIYGQHESLLFSPNELKMSLGLVILTYSSTCSVHNIMGLYYKIKLAEHCSTVTESYLLISQFFCYEYWNIILLCILISTR